MPTTTSLSGYSLSNNGPLTTTFSAPASCSTIFRVIGAATGSFDIGWNVECAFIPPADCNPSGSALSSMITSGLNNPKAPYVIVYHSPGLVCPAGWETVGAAAKVNPTSTSMSAAFNVSAPVPDEYVVDEGILDVFISALAVGETAVLCCPSSFTALAGNCYSAIPTSVFVPSTGCDLTYPPIDYTTFPGTLMLGASTYTGLVQSITGTLPPVTVTTSIAPADASSYVGVAYSAMFTLVHQASDTPGAAATTTSKTGAAGSIRGHENKLGITTVCCLALALGGLFVL